MGGASAVVDPFSGSVSLDRFKLIRSLDKSSVTYDVVSNGVLCTRAASTRAVSVAAGNFVLISAVPADARVSSDFLLSELARRVTVGLQSLSIDYRILDANEAELVGIIVQIKV